MTEKTFDASASSEAGQEDVRETTSMVKQEKEGTQGSDREKRDIAMFRGDADNSLLQVGSASEAFHYILLQVGGYGRWQWKLFFVSSFCGIFTALHNLSAGKSWWRRRREHFFSIHKH